MRCGGAGWLSPPCTPARLHACTPARLHAWAPGDAPLRLVEQTVAKDDPDPKALACSGRLVRQCAQAEEVWLRFVDGRPVSALTTQFLEWCCPQLASRG